MPRGGARTGAGRKPQRPRVQTFTPAVHQGGRADAAVSLIPPEDLPTDEREFWHRYAPNAIEKGTLTPNTLAGFRLLCEMDAEKRKTRAKMDEDGRTFLKVTVDGAGVEHQELKAHPLTSTYGRLAKAVEALMARFGLAPFGKAEPAARTKPAVNPFAQVAGR